MGNLLLDASSPAVVWDGTGTTVISGSFTPPAGSLMVVAWSGNNGSGNTDAVPFIFSTGITWTLIQHSARPDTPVTEGQAAMWWAVAPSATSRTVSVTNDDIATGSAIKVWVFTDDSGGTPAVGANKENGRAVAGSAVADSVTAVATGSRGVIVYTDWTAPAGTVTAGTGCTLTGGGAANQSVLAYAFALRTTADGVNGASITMNLTTPNTAQCRWVITEVIPAAVVVPGYGTPPIESWPGDGPMQTDRFMPDPYSFDIPVVADVNANAEQATHDLITGDPLPGFGAMDGPSPDIAHNTGDVTPVLAVNDLTAPAIGHTTTDATATITATDGTAPADTHTTNAPTASLAVSDTAPAIGHQANDVVSAQTTTDTTAPANTHTTAQPTVTLAVNDTTAPAIGHQTFDATTSTATLTNVNAELTTHDLAAGDVTAAQTTQAGLTNHAQVTPDASAALGLPAGTSTNTHTTTDALAAIGAPTTAAANSHATNDVVPAMSVGAIDAVITHQAFDATASTNSLVNADAADAVNAHTTNDATVTLAVSPGAGAIGHTTYDPTVSSTAAVSAGAADNTHQTQPAVAGVGKAAQDAANAQTTFNVGTTQTTQAEPATIALVAYDAIVSTSLQLPALVGVDAGSTWASNLDNPYAVVGANEQGTTPGAGSDHQATSRDVDSISVPTGIVG